MKKRLLSLLLAFAVILSLIPAINSTASAEQAEAITEAEVNAAEETGTDKCISARKVALGTPNSTLVLNGVEMEGYTVEKSFNLYFIKDKNNATVVLNGNSSWQYDGGLYYTKVETKYAFLQLIWNLSHITAGKEKVYLGVSAERQLFTTAAKQTAEAVLVTTYSDHDWGYVDNGNNTHTAVCKHCEKQGLTERHLYDENNQCVCGKRNPEICKVTGVEVKEQQEKVSSGFWFFRRIYTNYVYRVSTKTAGNVKVKEIYISGDGKEWKQGNQFQSQVAFGKLYIKIVDDNGETNIWEWDREGGAFALTQNCLTFSAAAPFTLTAAATGWLDNGGELEYSQNGSIWQVWDGSEIDSLNNKLYLRGSNPLNTLYCESTYTDTTLLLEQDASEKSVSVSGDVMTLLDYKNAEACEMEDSAFECLFDSNSALTDASNLLLTADELTEYCYSGMFYGCENLEVAPQLPATVLAENCHYEMFRDCTSLKAAPSLSATELKKYCYFAMFKNCESLEAAPELPAETVAENCYFEMFSGCKSLKTATALPAKTMAKSCYEKMFKGCSSLVNAPVLSAKELAGRCCYEMFKDCVSLETAPQLDSSPSFTSDTKNSLQCYDGMFWNCSSLKVGTAKNSDTSGATAIITVADNNYKPYNMFTGALLTEEDQNDYNNAYCYCAAITYYYGVASEN